VSFKVVGVVFLFISLIPLGIGLFFLFDTLQFLGSATSKATSTIVSCPRPKKSSSACTTTFTFSTELGQSVTVTGSFACSGFEVGQQQPIVHDSAHPQEARIASFLGL